MATTREKLMAKLHKAYPSLFLKTTEEFDGRSGGIWTGSEDRVVDRDGYIRFDYYAEDYQEKKYIFGVRVHLHNFLLRNGWYGEWYDCGTIMLYQI